METTVTTPQPRTGFTPIEIFGNVLRAMGFEDGNGAAATLSGDPGDQGESLGLIVFQATAIQPNEAAAVVQITMGWTFRASVLWYDNAGEVSHERHYQDLPSFIADEMLNWQFQEPLDAGQAFMVLDSHLQISDDRRAWYLEDPSSPWHAAMNESFTLA